MKTTELIEKLKVLAETYENNALEKFPEDHDYWHGFSRGIEHAIDVIKDMEAAQ